MQSKIILHFPSKKILLFKKVQTNCLYLNMSFLILKLAKTDYFILWKFLLQVSLQTFV